MKGYVIFVDALDEGFPKMALQMCTKILKKSPESQIHQALSSLSLVRIGNYEKALEISENLRKKLPIDEDVLNVLQIVFQELNMADNAVEMFENALKKKSNDEEFVRNWFFSMVRTNNIRGQQKAAMSLQKIFGKRNYYYWAVMSLELLKMIRMNEGEKEFFQTLSYRLILKTIEENNKLYGLSSSEELHLCIKVLLSCNKLEDALGVLESDIYKTFIDVDFLRIKLDLLFELKKWEVLFSQCRDYIENGNNDWKVFDMQIKAAINLAESNPSSSILLDLANYYKEKKQKFPYLRNLGLASLKLSFLISDNGITDDKLNSCIEYFEIFSLKTSCFEDLRPFVEKLEKKYQDQFLMHIFEFCKAKVNDMKKNYIEVLKNVKKFEYLINYNEFKDEETCVVFSLQLVKEYGNSLFLDDNLNITDKQYGDDFLILSVHVLINAFFIGNDQSYLIQAILFLELGLLHSKYNFQFKLLLVRLYCMIGAFSLALSTYQSLSIKQIQYDTLSYIFMTKCSNYYPSKSLQNELRISKYIYISNIKEVPEMLVLAYKNGSYSNIDNFIEFATRLNNSIWRHMLRHELLHLSYLIDNKISDEIIGNNGFTQEEYYDNRDFTIMVDFGTINDKSKQIKNRVISVPDENWLKIQNFKMSFVNLLISGTIEDIKAKSMSDEWLLDGLKFDTLSEFEMEMMFLFKTFLSFLIQVADQKAYDIEENRLKEWIEKNLVISLTNVSNYNDNVLEYFVFLLESCKSILIFGSFIKKSFKTLRKLHAEIKKIEEVVRNFYKDIILYVSSLKDKIVIADFTKFVVLFEPNLQLFKIDKHFIETRLEKINDSRRNSLDNLDNIVFNMKT
ncbi:hypothetical protein T552_00602 [Pneumocystis carinii B80]|uniref:N-terminal acetyltransferase B complex subunit NAA25 homolog n=1 Tax=Pneumocystis carinii (strain B80) TaxID=1408658 RepID=A0A0W4ZP12_PNEC8|nr:hypothetical protein T552_00602 [Pneumocystis carinii B80]KTW30124.1 hypothetical protein T552_00602 [Pneumocystis carinii B80]